MNLFIRYNVDPQERGDANYYLISAKSKKHAQRVIAEIQSHNDEEAKQHNITTYNTLDSARSGSDFGSLMDHIWTKDRPHYKLVCGLLLNSTSNITILTYDELMVDLKNNGYTDLTQDIKSVKC